MLKIVKSILIAILLSPWCAWAMPLNINTATAEQLADVLSGVGKTKAESIVKERDTNGPFQSLEDLEKRVKGVGPAIIEKNKDLIDVGQNGSAATEASAVTNHTAAEGSAAASKGKNPTKK